MSERFERLFSLTGNLYAESSPVIIAAGALLRDTETGRILAQLKFKSISPKPIKAIKVQISPLDTVGKPLGEKITYDYLDLNVDRDMEFGQMKAIPVMNPATRSFTAEVSETAFEDNSVWTMDGAAWTPLPKRVALEKAVGDQELAKQYRIQYGEKAWYKPVKGDKIWICTCGAVNAEEEDKCHACGNEAAALFSCDYEKLKADASKRVEAETAVKKKNSQKVKRLTAIVVPVFIIIVASILLVTKVFIPNQKYKQAADLLAAGDYIEAIHEFTALNGYKDSEDQAVIAGYRQAEALFEAGDYDNAIEWFQLLADNNYFDSAKRVEEVKIAKEENSLQIKYTKAEELLASGEFLEAAKVFASLGDFGDSAERAEEAIDKQNEKEYSAAIDLLNQKEYLEASEAFRNLGNYRDSAGKAELAFMQYKEHLLSSASVGETIIWGNYEQDNDLSNGQEFIEWLVLSRDSDRILVISLYGLDCIPYNESWSSVTWDKSSLRNWLNEDFLTSAFSPEERDRILAVTVNADKNPKYGISSGKPTEDMVFLLSIQEANSYFSSADARACSPTDYANAQGCRDHPGWWWLRTPGKSERDAACVNGSGNIYENGIQVKHVDGGWRSPAVRPAIWISLSP